MSKPGDVTSIKRITSLRDIMPSRPPLPEGQDKRPVRNEGPGLSVAMGQNRLDPVPAGRLRYVRKRGADDRPNTGWLPIAEAGETLEFKDEAAPRPAQGPYPLGGSRETPGET